MPVPSEGELLGFLNAHANEFKTANGPTPLLSDIRETVLAAWHREQRRVAADVAYQKIRRRYDIVIDPSPGSTSESP